MKQLQRETLPSTFLCDLRDAKTGNYVALTEIQDTRDVCLETCVTLAQVLQNLLHAGFAKPAWAPSRFWKPASSNFWKPEWTPSRFCKTCLKQVIRMRKTYLRQVLKTCLGSKQVSSLMKNLLGSGKNLLGTMEKPTWPPSRFFRLEKATSDIWTPVWAPSSLFTKKPASDNLFPGAKNLLRTCSFRCKNLLQAGSFNRKTCLERKTLLQACSFCWKPALKKPASSRFKTCLSSKQV